MGIINGKEPAHWHGGAGRHRMQDPRQFGFRRADLSADEIAYLAHLDSHQDADRSTEPRPGDSAGVRNVLALIEHNRRAEALLFELVHTLRKRDALRRSGPAEIKGVTE